MCIINAFGAPKNICAAFTGYRPEKIRLSPSLGNPEEYIRGILNPVIIELYGQGVRVFLSGMAEGFDLWAAAAVLSLRDSGICPDAVVAAVIPYRGQPANYSVRSKELYGYVCDNASYGITLSECYYLECFYRRNDYLVENSNIIIAYYDGQSGGTRYTVRKAGKSGVPVINICARELTLF